MMPQRWVNFLIMVLLCEICSVLLSSIQQFNSMRSGSAAVSLIIVSKSSLKSNSTYLTLLSCCNSFCFFFNFAVVSHIVYCDFFEWSVSVLLNQYCWVCPGFMCRYRFFGVVRGGGFCVPVGFLFSGGSFLSVCCCCSVVCLCGISSPKFWKYLPQCETL